MYVGAAWIYQLPLPRLPARKRYCLCLCLARASCELPGHQGEARFYSVKADSGNTVSRGFCAECGSPLFSKLSGMPEVVGVRAGSLDDPSWHRPAMDIFTASAQPWDYMNPDLPKFPGYRKLS